MTVRAGAKIRAADFQRVAVSVVTSSSSTFTAETVVLTVTGDLEDGRTYLVKATGLTQSSVGGDLGRWILRQDSISGTRMNLSNVYLPGATSAHGFIAEAEFTASSTASKTFVLTLQRLSGTGNHQLTASAEYPARISIWPLAV